MTREEHETHSDDFAKGNISAGAFVLFQQIRISTLEAQLKAKDEEITMAKTRHQLEHDRYLINEKIIQEKDEEITNLGELIQAYLIPSRNYEAEIRAKDEEIEKLRKALV